MAIYPDKETDLRVSHNDLRRAVGAVFRACGMNPDDADLLTDTLVAADLRGIHSHGVIRVPDYVKKLEKDGVDPEGRPTVVRDSGSAVVVDGSNSMGQIGSTFAMKEVIERAGTHNLAFAAVRGSNHCGAMSYYTALAPARDMIGIAATNALPTMAPWGGIDKILGINPLSVAVPAGREHPVVFDAAFSYSSHGKIRVFEQKGLPIPETWAFDSKGRPTTDAATALSGLLQPIGGYKGTGLALLMGILSSLLSGASYGTQLGDMVEGPRPGEDGHFYMALKIAAFIEPETFKDRVDAIICELRASAAAPGHNRVYYPGELEALTAERYRQDGIPLNRVTLTDIAQTAQKLQVDPELVPWR
jgi:LDH2 family malate/lactate/ureidoglycolate dehydrogenase